MIDEAAAINHRLFIASWVLHTLVALLSVFGILYRRAVGAIILYPFQVVVEIGKMIGGVGKKVHEKV